MSDMMSDRMSSVSNSSKFSIKSQQVIAEQGATIAKKDETIDAMRSMLIKAGIDPDAIQTQDRDSTSTEINMEVDVNSKKRLPSGSIVDI